MTSQERPNPILNEEELKYVDRMKNESEKPTINKRSLNERGVELYLLDLDNGLNDMSRDQLLYYKNFLEHAIKSKNENGLEQSSIDRVNKHINNIDDILNKNINTKPENKKKEVEKYILDIGEASVGACIESLNEALEDNGSNQDNIMNFKQALERAKTERQLLLKRIVENPDTEFKDNGNIVTNQEKMEQSILRINKALESIPTENMSYESISEQISQYLEELKESRTTELETKVSEYILQNEGVIRSLIHSTSIEDRNKDSELFNKLTEDLAYLHTLKSELANKIPKNEVQVDVKYNHINLSDELSLESMAVLKTNQYLLNRIIVAINEYNEHLTDSDEEKSRYFNIVENLRLEFLDYKRDFFEERSKMPKEKRKGGQGDKDNKKILYGKNEDAREEYSITNADEDSRKNKVESKTWRQEKNTLAAELKPKTPEKVDVAAENIDSNTTPKVATQEEIFVIEEGKDYGEMIKDKKFDNWLNSIYKAMLTKGEAVSQNAEDIESWYSRYQDAIPYIEKLNAVFEDIKRGNDKIKTLMSEDKIGDLLYEMCKHPDPIKRQIEAIYSSFEKTKEKEEEIERFNKMEELKVAIGDKDLKGEDVKLVLETNNHYENLGQNAAQLELFLKDIYNNYDFYNSDSRSETDPNNIYYTFRKWSAAKSGSGKPLGFFGRMKTKLFASFPQELKPEALNNFEALIKELRKLDLVDRKSGGMDKVIANKTRLADIIGFINDGGPIKTELNEEDAKKLKIFNDLYKVFTNIKYKSNIAEQTARKALDENTLDTSITGVTTKPIPDILFETDSEKKIFENDAKYQVNIELLNEIEGEINNFPKTKNQERLKSIISRFTEVELVLTELGNDTDDKLALDKVNLKLHELILKNTNRDSYEELSASFKTYERILQSDNVSKEKKVEYLTELIEALKKHRKNSANTMLQNVTLNAIITKYQKELTSIN